MPDVLDEPAAPSYIRTLPESECYELLAVSTVGRIGFVCPPGYRYFLSVFAWAMNIGSL